MKIYKKEYNLVKGKALIVGKENKDMSVDTDGIVMHTAYYLSDKPELLANATITDSDKIIYICGHGSAEKHTIGKQRLRDIAEQLIKAGYKGKQHIYITSCEADKRVDCENTIAELLKIFLRESLLDTYNFIPNNDIVVKGLVEDSSVTVKDEDDTASIWVIESDEKCFKPFFIDRYQVNTLRKLGCRTLKVSKDRMEEDLNNYYTKFWLDIQEYKNRLTRGEVYYIRRGCISEFISTIAFASVLAFIFSTVFKIDTGKELSIAIIISSIISCILYQIEVMCTKLDNIPAVVYMSSFRHAGILIVLYGAINQFIGYNLILPLAVMLLSCILTGIDLIRK